MNHATVVRTGRSRFGALVIVAALAASVGLTVGSTAPSLALAPTLSSLAITPTAFDFGDVPVGSTSATQLVTVTNVSGASMVLSAAGGSAGVFGGSSDCNFATLAPGASCHLDYQFSPTVAGAQTGSAVGTVQGQFFSLTFKGNGVNQFLITPAGFDFGDVAVGTTSAQQAVTVTNIGHASVVGNLSGVVLPKPAGAETSISFEAVTWLSRSLSRGRGTSPRRGLGTKSFVSSKAVGTRPSPPENASGGIPKITRQASSDSEARPFVARDRTRTGDPRRIRPRLT